MPSTSGRTSRSRLYSDSIMLFLRRLFGLLDWTRGILKRTEAFPLCASACRVNLEASEFDVTRV